MNISDTGRLIATLFHCIMWPMQKEKNRIKGNYFVGLASVFSIHRIFCPVIDYNGHLLIQQKQNLLLITRSLPFFYNNIEWNWWDNRDGNETLFGWGKFRNIFIKAKNYKEFNNVFIPTVFYVLWRLDKSDFNYAKFTVTEVEYNKPERFLIRKTI